MQDGNHIARITGFARALCSAQDYHSLLDIISRQTCSNLSAENLLLWIYDDVGRALRCEASSLTTLDRALVREAHPADSGFLGEMLQVEAPRIFQDLEAASHLGAAADGLILQTALFASMHDRANPVGLIEAVNIQGESFTSADVALLAEFARLAAPAIIARRAQEAMGAGMLRP